MPRHAIRADRTDKILKRLPESNVLTNDYLSEVGTTLAVVRKYRRTFMLLFLPPSDEGGGKTQF